jgi:hypothetical protein
MGFDVAFDAAWWAKHWWLLFPILGFAIAFYSLYLDHRRKRGWMDLMRTYAQQGKEPPASLTNAATSGDWQWHGPPAHYGHSGRFSDVRRAIILGVLAAAFGYLYVHNADTNSGFGIAAVVLGALAVGFLIIAIVRPRSADGPPPPPKSNGS